MDEDHHTVRDLLKRMEGFRKIARPQVNEIEKIGHNVLRLRNQARHIEHVAKNTDPESREFEMLMIAFKRKKKELEDETRKMLNLSKRIERIGHSF